MMGAAGLGRSGSRGAGCGDGVPAGGIRDAQAHAIARRPQTKITFTSVRTLVSIRIQEIAMATKKPTNLKVKKTSADKVKGGFAGSPQA
jgi:hypothetical protein